MQHRSKVMLSTDLCQCRLHTPKLASRHCSTRLDATARSQTTRPPARQHIRFRQGCSRRPARDVCLTSGWPKSASCSSSASSHPQKSLSAQAASSAQAPSSSQPAQSAAVAKSEAPKGDVLIEMKNVYKSFGSKPILRGANITIRRGEAVGIIGGSGTGKSTTLRIMAGLLTPDVGQVLIKGKARKGLLADDKDLASQLKVGMVFQNGALFDSLNVKENVGFMLYEHSNLPNDRIEELVAQALKAVGLSGVEPLFPGELSGGMKKRVALARAIIRDNENDHAEQVVMYDEPTAGLDPVASTVVEDLIRSLQSTRAAQKTTEGISSYIVVTHQHSTIRRAVDRLIFLHEGQVVWEGPTADFDKSEEAIVQQFSQGSLEGPIKYL